MSLQRMWVSLLITFTPWDIFTENVSQSTDHIHTLRCLYRECESVYWSHSHPEMSLQRMWVSLLITFTPWDVFTENVSQSTDHIHTLRCLYRECESVCWSHSHPEMSLQRMWVSLLITFTPWDVFTENVSQSADHIHTLRCLYRECESVYWSHSHPEMSLQRMWVSLLITFTRSDVFTENVSQSTDHIHTLRCLYRECESVCWSHSHPEMSLQRMWVSLLITFTPWDVFTENVSQSTDHIHTLRCLYRECESVCWSHSHPEMSSQRMWVSLLITFTPWDVFTENVSQSTDHIHTLRCLYRECESVYWSHSHPEMSLQRMWVSLLITFTPWDVFTENVSQSTDHIHTLRCLYRECESVYWSHSHPEMSLQRMWVSLLITFTPWDIFTENVSQSTDHIHTLRCLYRECESVCWSHSHPEMSFIKLLWRVTAKFCLSFPLLHQQHTRFEKLPLLLYDKGRDMPECDAEVLSWKRVPSRSRLEVTILKGISIRGNGPLSNGPITMVYQCTRSIVISSFKKGTLPLIEIPF